MEDKFGPIGGGGSGVIVIEQPQENVLSQIIAVDDPQPILQIMTMSTNENTPCFPCGTFCQIPVMLFGALVPAITVCDYSTQVYTLLK